MKVKDLLEILKTCDHENEVIMAKDGEGNDFSPLSDCISNSSYKAKTTYNGEAGYATLTPELIQLGFVEEDILQGGVPAIILWPTY